jgi:hypothetical protein
MKYQEIPSGFLITSATLVNGGSTHFFSAATKTSLEAATNFASIGLMDSNL